MTLMLSEIMFIKKFGRLFLIIGMIAIALDEWHHFFDSYSVVVGNVAKIDSSSKNFLISNYL